MGVHGIVNFSDLSTLSFQKLVNGSSDFPSLALVPTVVSAPESLFWQAVTPPRIHLSLQS